MKNNRVLAVIIVFLITGVFSGCANRTNQIEKQTVQSVDIADTGKKTETEKKTNSDEKVPKDQTKQEIPEKSLVKVPFTSQAPFANWDAKHEEACEEASLLMVAYYLEGKTLNRDIAEREIQKLINFQIEKYGDYRDSNAEQVVRLAKDFYGIKNLKVVYDFKKEDLKNELAQKNPIIIPAAGRMLGNPNFTYPGPLYHNLVLVGYEKNILIANDPGTRKGEGYRYDLDILYDAIHDFPGDKRNILEGRKAMIVVDSQL